MKAFPIIIALALFLTPCFPLLAHGAEVNKVSPEKFRKLTPEQKKKFKEMGRDAQKPAEGSINDYNEVGDSVDKVKDKVHDYIKKNFGPKVRRPLSGGAVRG